MREQPTRTSDPVKDTIAAVITAPGTGAMGALRLSGPHAFDAAALVFRSKSGRTTEALSGYSLTFGGVYLEGSFLDQALLLKMKAPHSFTGEDVAELQCHGGMVVMRRLMEAVTSLQGLLIRPAEPGEFSQRAFLNGKMDLSQAEAVMELVSASNPRAAFIAAGQLAGGLSREIKRLREGILMVLAEIEVEIDFPDEEWSGSAGAATRRDSVRRLLDEAAGLIASSDRGRIYREGIRVVFYGRPNVGKSSLLNGILREPRAIVTEEPGTTRDVLEEQILLKGIPVILTDTAGIRETGSQAEQAGVDRAKEMAARADLIVYVVDLPEGMQKEDALLLAELDKEKTIIVLNKQDLAPPEAGRDEYGMLPDAFKEWACCSLCALEPESLESLADSIRLFIDQRYSGAPKEEFLLNSRQRDALLRARQALAAAAEALTKEIPEDVVAIDLKQAWSCLGELTGESLQTALVETIFSKFCLGK